MKFFKQWLVLLVSIGFMQFTWADSYTNLYESAGWSVQADHFDTALKTIQKQYKNVLPPILYQSIVTSSNRRFEPGAMKQRGILALKNNLSDPNPALAFFESDLGKKIVTAETEATTKESLQKNQQGVPVIKIDSKRRALFQQLADAIAYRQATVDVSLSLTGIASDTVDNLFPGMGLGESVKQLTPTQAQIEKQVDANLENILIYVYRNLTDEELQQFVAFAESSNGKEYYQVAQSVISASVNN